MLCDDLFINIPHSLGTNIDFLRGGGTARFMKPVTVEQSVCA